MAGTLTKYAGTIKKHEDNRMVRYRQIGILLSMTRMKIVTVAPVFTSVA